MTREQLAAALRKADAAGNVEDARRLAGAIRSLDGSPAQGTYTAKAPPVRSLDPVGATARTMQKPMMDAVGAAVLGRPLPTQPPPPMDPLAPKGGWSPQQEQANLQRIEAERSATYNQPQPAAPQSQNWNDQIATWISENVTPVAQKAGESVGSMVLGQRPGGEAVAEIGKGVGGGLSEFGATAFRNPVDAANQAIETFDPVHQFAYAYNDADAALKAGVAGDWDKAGNELKDLFTSGSFAAMSFLPGNQVYKGVKAATGKGGPTISSQLFKPGPTAADRAADILIKKMKADGLTLEDLQKVQRGLANRGDSGVYETFSELGGLAENSSGANLRGLAMALGSVPGPAQEAILARVAQNAEQLPKRTSRAASRATGQDASKAAATLDELEARLKQDSVPLYDNFYAAPVDEAVDNAEIAPILDTQQGRAAKGSALRNLRTQEASLKAAVASGRVDMQSALARVTASIDSLSTNKSLTPEALDHVKRAFDDQIEAAGQGSYTASNLRSAKRNFAESVSRATGGTYGEALGFYEGGKRLEEAFDIGLNAMKQPTWQLERAMNKGNRGSPFSAGEVEAIAMGVARHIEDLIEANDQAALTKLMKGKALKNLSTALDDPKAAAKFEQSIQRLAANREWGRRVSGGSDTAMRLAAVDDASRLEEDPITRALDRAANSTAPPSVFGAAWQAVAKPAANAATDAYRRLKYPGIRDEEVNAALAPMMGNAMTKGNLDQVASTIEARLAAKNPKRLPPPPGGPPPITGPKGPPKLSAPAASAASPPRPPVKAGMEASPEAVGGIGGGVAGYFGNPTDANQDGVIDDKDRGLNAMGGLVSGVVGGNIAKRGANAMRGAFKPQTELMAAKGSYGARPSAMGDLTGHQAAQKQLKELEAYRKTAPASERAAVNQEIADLRQFLEGNGPPVQAGFGGPPKPQANALKGPPKKQGPALSRAAEEATRELKAARSAYNRASNKWVMKDDRELRVKPLEDRVVAAEAKLAQVLKNDARIKTLAARGRSVIESPNVNKPIAYGIGGAVIGASAIGAYNALKPQERGERPMSPTDPAFYWSTVTADKDKMVPVQLALKEWGEWPDDTEATGINGKVTKAAIKSWRYDRGLDPDAPMTKADTARLLAGPKGYQDRNGKTWRYGADGAPVSPP